jgi:microcystin-dependent protein
LLGTIYGGDGIRTFALPNLQTRMPIHVGGGFSQGENSGEVSHTLITQELPSHTHGAQGVSTVASSPGATGNTWGASIQNPYGMTPNTGLGPAALSTTGGGQPHPNMPPYLVLNFVIALQGIFPSRN